MVEPVDPVEGGELPGFGVQVYPTGGEVFAAQGRGPMGRSPQGGDDRRYAHLGRDSVRESAEPIAVRRGAASPPSYLKAEA